MIMVVERPYWGRTTSWKKRWRRASFAGTRRLGWHCRRDERRFSPEASSWGKSCSKDWGGKKGKLGLKSGSSETLKRGRGKGREVSLSWTPREGFPQVKPWPVLLCWGAHNLENPLKLVVIALAREECLPSHHLGKDASGGPHIYRSRVVPAAQQHIRAAIP